MSENQQSLEVPLKGRSNNYYKTIFNKYDRDGDGFINIGELSDLIESREYEYDIPAHVVRKIHQMSDSDRDAKLNFDEFVEMINNPQFSQVFGHYMTSLPGLIQSGPFIIKMSSESDSESIPLQNRNQYVYYKKIFDHSDKNNDGLLSYAEFTKLVKDQNLPISDEKILHFFGSGDINNDKVIDYEEFYQMTQDPHLRKILHKYVATYINSIIPRRLDPTRSVTDGEYEEEYSCYPPAVGMILISLIEIIFFCVDEAMEYNSTAYASGPTATIFIYEPCKREEAWRYLSYMFVHVGVFHLIVNLFVQLLLGVPLEMVHKWWRVLLVYASGVVAGSLFTSIVDPHVKLAGASGGVYSLITAHVASIIMNWKEMSFPIVQLLVFLFVAASDIGQAIYNRYVLDLDQHIGYAAHFAGAVAGLLVGINALRNLNVTKTERVIWWVSMVAYILWMGTCIVWNLAWPSYFECVNMRRGQLFSANGTRNH